MMKYTLLLVCSYLLILAQKGEAAECPSLNSKELARLMELVVKEDVHKEVQVRPAYCFLCVIVPGNNCVLLGIRIS